MPMLEITLPETADRFIEAQIAAGKYASASECILDIIEKERIKVAKEKLTELVREGMESGEGVEINDEYWSRFDEKLQAELGQRRIA